MLPSSAFSSETTEHAPSRISIRLVGWLPDQSINVEATRAATYKDRTGRDCLTSAGRVCGYFVSAVRARDEELKRLCDEGSDCVQFSLIGRVEGGFQLDEDFRRLLGHPRSPHRRQGFARAVLVPQ